MDNITTQRIPMIVGTLVRFRMRTGLVPTVEATIITTAATGEMVLARLAIICMGKAIKIPSMPAFDAILGISSMTA